jgi:hypothetical protein
LPPASPHEKNRGERRSAPLEVARLITSDG